MEQFTAKAVFDLYTLLPNEEKIAFLRLVGQMSTAEVPFVITSELPLPEQQRYSDMMFEEHLWQLFPYLQREARRLAREKPQLSDEEFDREFHDRIRASMENYNETIAALEQAKLKESRDRKSDPETVSRNVEICDLRKQDSKKWSLGRLAGKYGISKRAISLILADDVKWRQLAASLQAE
jgi:hypothetical protein